MLKEKEVYKALQENITDKNGKQSYILHLKKNGEIVDDAKKADINLGTQAKYALKEDINDEDFTEIVKDLTKQANEYLEVWGTGNK